MEVLRVGRKGSKGDQILAPVRGSPSQSTSLHHRSQEFVVARLEKLPKTGRKPVFFPKFASKRQFFCRKTKIVPVPRDSWDGTAEMGLPIWRVVVLHSHNPDGPQIWHAFNLD